MENAAGLGPHPDSQEILRRFVARAAQVGVRVESAATTGDAADRIAALLAERRARTVAVWATPDLAPVLDRLRTAGVDLVQPGAPPERVAEADAGFTGAEWGIADTGTLVLASGPDQPRLASLLPPVHIALLDAERVLPDLLALFERTGALPSTLTLITGPSRSADIGLVPVLGAHGPMEVVVVLVCRPTAAA
jgi:L-lactate utilization protein LutC